MYFIGSQQLNPRKGDYSLIASMFTRLPAEVSCRKNITRFVGYEAHSQECGHLRFFGMESDLTDCIPDGMISWELNDTTWTVSWSAGRQERKRWREEIRWLWLNSPGCDFGRSTGEFVARGSPEWRGVDIADLSVFRLFANVPFDLRQRSFKDDAVLVDYDKRWPERYTIISSWLSDALGTDIALRIEHYGSTSIPGMPAKPVIDILVEIPSIEQGKKRALASLNDETWEYWSYADHIVFFKRIQIMRERICHVHMAPKGHDVWKGLAFRDYLRAHPEDASRYAKLKRQLAQTYQSDREKYTIQKADFVNRILMKASEGF